MDLRQKYPVGTIVHYAPYAHTPAHVRRGKVVGHDDFGSKVKVAPELYVDSGIYALAAADWVFDRLVDPAATPCRPGCSHLDGAT